MRQVLVWALLVVASICLPLALFNPVASYSVAQKEEIDELIGGEAGARALYLDVATNLADYAEDNAVEIEARAIQIIDDADLCRAGLCSTLRRLQVIQNALRDRLRPVLLEAGPDNITRYYEPFTNWAYNAYQASEFGQVKSSNIFQVAVLLFSSEQVFLGLLIVAFAIVFPVFKLIAAWGYLTNGANRVFKTLYGITSKFSLAEVFVIALLIVSFQAIPFLKIDMGVLAVLGYTLFTLSILAVDLLRGFSAEE